MLLACRMRILVTGGCGYIGCRLTPVLLAAGHQVVVLDTMLFGERLTEAAPGDASLQILRGDIRDSAFVHAALSGVEAVVHLAGISNDPSADLDPELTRQVNRDAALALLASAARAGVRRFVFASTSTVYGVRDEPEIDETLEHRPITLYGEYKSEVDQAVLAANRPGFETVCLRAATVGGWSPRMRLDLAVNALTYHAVAEGRIVVHGGGQMRPVVAMDDLLVAYRAVLHAPVGKVAGRAFNVSFANHSLMEIAERVREAVHPDAAVVVEPVFDRRSYRVSSGRIARELGVYPRLDVGDMAREVAAALRDGRIADPGGTVHRNVAHLIASGSRPAVRS